MPPLPSLQVLDLHAKKVTDSGVKKLTGLKNLRALNLFVNLTDAGLKELASHPNLRYLTTEGKNVTDAGLKELARIKSLRTLLLINAKLTDAGVNELMTALPGCHVIR